MTSNYLRTAILNFSELPETAQIEILKDRENSDAHETTWIANPKYKGEFLPLDMFERANGSKLWTGYYGQSYFDAYFIKIDRFGEIATIAHRYF